MKSFALVLCLCAAACSKGGLESPVSPTVTATSSTMLAATAGHELPFRGTFTLTTRGSFNCPPTCPPTILTIEGIQNGTATNLGRFTAVSVDVVNIATTEATGTLDFTAANGDQLRTTTVSHEEAFTPPEHLNGFRHRDDRRRNRQVRGSDWILHLPIHGSDRLRERDVVGGRIL